MRFFCSSVRFLCSSMRKCSFSSSSSSSLEEDEESSSLVTSFSFSFIAGGASCEFFATFANSLNRSPPLPEEQFSANTTDFVFFGRPMSFFSVAGGFFLLLLTGGGGTSKCSFSKRTPKRSASSSTAFSFSFSFFITHEYGFGFNPLGSLKSKIPQAKRPSIVPYVGRPFSFFTACDLQVLQYTSPFIRLLSHWVYWWWLCRRPWQLDSCLSPLNGSGNALFNLFSFSSTISSANADDDDDAPFLFFSSFIFNISLTFAIASSSSKLYDDAHTPITSRAILFTIEFNSLFKFSISLINIFFNDYASFIFINLVFQFFFLFLFLLFFREPRFP